MRMRGELVPAYAMYEAGLEQGVDSERERRKISVYMLGIQGELRRGELDEASAKIGSGNVDVAMDMLQKGAWGDDDVLAQSVALVQKKAQEHIEKDGRIGLSHAQFELAIRYKDVQKDLVQTANRTLTQHIDKIEKSSDNASRFRALKRVMMSPAWKVQGIDSSLMSRALAQGDRALQSLEPEQSAEDLRLIFALRQAHGFAHRPWDELASRHIETYLGSQRQLAQDAATALDLKKAQDILSTLQTSVPLTPSQHEQNKKLFEQLIKTRGDALITTANTQRSLGQNASAHVLASLANYYHVSPPPNLALNSSAERLAGQPPTLLGVSMTVAHQRSGNCAGSADPPKTFGLGAEGGEVKNASVTVRYTCEKSDSLSYSTSRGGTTTRTGVEERKLSAYEYCSKANSLGTSADRGRCTRYLDSMNGVERDRLLTSSETVVTGEETTVIVAVSGTISTSASWGAKLQFMNKNQSFGAGSLNDSVNVNGSGNTTYVNDYQSGRSYFNPPYVSVSLSNGGSVSINAETGELNMLQAGSWVTIPIGQGPDAARMAAVNYVRDYVSSENDRRRRKALAATVKALESAQASGNENNELASLLRLAMLKSREPSNQRIDIGLLDEAQQKRFVLTEEPVDVVRKAIQRQRAALAEGSSIPLTVKEFSVSDYTIEANREGGSYLPYNVDTSGERPEIDAWVSTGVEQNLLVGPVAYNKGSSVVEVAASAERVPLVDAPLSSAISPKLTLKNTSLSASFYFNPPGSSDSRGYSLSLRHAFVRRGGANDPKITTYFGLGYTQLARVLEPDLRLTYEEGDDNPKAAQRDVLIARYRQGAGFRFLGAELGMSIPLTLKSSVDFGGNLNMLGLMDYFDDATTGEYLPMSNAYMGLTYYPVQRFYIHARASMWTGQAEATSPLGGMVKLGVRL